MYPKRLIIGCALAFVTLAGCSSTTDKPAQAPAEPAGDHFSGRCDAAPVQGLIGKTASFEILEEARRKAGAQTARVLGPNDAVTMEYNAQRLNLETDAAQVIQRVTCG
ncbi:I78 family peptidase inhibitor [Pseudomonas indica]|uniref:Peptidase inhibitor I78 family protein n=1 Tax=Pseudomonas indica TaxID=137658 RepID=A0A1G9CX24_9PSED|nr:I78 family peptidase inhibitor [Pseudomonas indica]MBU3056631.1 hypothetical protein [Pseudomonas indica]PAU60917.1 hypothetical protein BZL42_10110 [Pseudomonas indica]SDK56173.1 Peptidase inhibitor I78 family protein [Pseudomonas indica]